MNPRKYFNEYLFFRVLLLDSITNAISVKRQLVEDLPPDRTNLVLNLGYLADVMWLFCLDPIVQPRSEARQPTLILCTNHQVVDQDLLMLSLVQLICNYESWLFSFATLVVLESNMPFE